MPPQSLLETNIPGYPCRQGKVRDIYDLGVRLVIVATDRISAFDWILPTGIPDKGKILTALTLFWLNFLQVPNHLLSTEIADLPTEFQDQTESLKGRTMLVKKTQVVPIECVARGYLVGSGWKEYQLTDKVCGIDLPKGLQQAQQLDEPIFTPATKAESGHDENISEARAGEIVGAALIGRLRELTLMIYERGVERAHECGIILADTKFEFGMVGDTLVLIDEVLTPDSSRFWPKDSYQAGGPQPSFD
jgi:phosphoribosylaminoimidazole-succinocarboxamide synthase